VQAHDYDRGGSLGDEPVGPGSGGDLDRLMRITARLCYLIRDANRESWFSPGVRSQITDLHADMKACADESPLRLQVEAGTFILGKANFEEPPRGVRQLVNMFERKDYSGVEYSRELTPLEVVVFAQTLQSKTGRVGPEDLSALKNLRFIERDVTARIAIPEVIVPSRLGEHLEETQGADQEVRSLVADITAAIDDVSSSDNENKKSPHETPLLDLVTPLGENAEIALILSSLRRHDEYTYDHSINVGLLSICLGRFIGWRGRDLHEFGTAALIHDVGKLYTPLEILNKPGRLTPQEWVVMKRHPRDGYDILLEGGVGSEIAPYIALEHHTAPDGTGYPPLSYPPEQMHQGSRIVKLADVYDAFTTIRPYRSQTRPKEVLKMLTKQRGTHFDGDLVDAFIEMMGDYPIATTLKLRSGRIALVVDVFADSPTRPVVRLLRDANERPVRKLTFVDLREKNRDTGQYFDEVEEAIDPVIRNIPIGRYI
jgi:HD-GYP domain-containing protein (c-di-GMP phosphodiesterase class II)